MMPTREEILSGAWGAAAKRALLAHDAVEAARPVPPARAALDQARLRGSDPRVQAALAHVPGHPKKGRPVGMTNAKTPGAAAVRELVRQLLAKGYVDFARLTAKDLDAMWCERVDRWFVRELAWALDATPPRGYQSDVAFPCPRLLVEVKGGAHAAGRKKVAQDIEREGLAVSLGWTVLPVTPDQVWSGEALSRIEAKLGTIPGA